MNFLFVHQNFPGQYLHLVRHLAAQPEHRVVFITQRQDGQLPGVIKRVYKPHRKITPNIHHYLLGGEAAIINAQQVARVAMELKESGFVPDVMIGHNGWGEIWYLKDVFPTVPLLGYFEFFYRAQGADVGFDTTSPVVNPVTFDTGPRIRTKNLGNLLALDAVDMGQCPTQWQKSLYPQRYQDCLRVVHEGIDTEAVRPDPQATYLLPDGSCVRAGDEVLTYVARNLEPYRGFHSFMRSLPAILKARPRTRVLVVGGDDVSYGSRPPEGKTFRELMLQELGADLDLARVHFLGKLPYRDFVTVLQVSRVHVYLTYPFVLSWSMLEAMAAGCLIVGSRTAPVEEVIQDGENGLLVDFFSPLDIASRVIDVLAEPQAFDSLRRKARETVIDRYDLRTTCLPGQLRLVAELTGRPVEQLGSA